MHFQILSIGHPLPNWLPPALDTYQKRFRAPFRCDIKTLPAVKQRDTEKRGAHEAEKLLAACPRGSVRIALDEKGKTWSSRALADKLSQWRGANPSVSFLIGGADGHHQDCLQSVDEVWSLSSLTFPHAFVPLLVVEQLYRAMTLIQGHPYHRD